LATAEPCLEYYKKVSLQNFKNLKREDLNMNSTKDKDKSNENFNYEIKF
jgi:hypothetical protein